MVIQTVNSTTCSATNAALPATRVIESLTRSAGVRCCMASRSSLAIARTLRSMCVDTDRGALLAAACLAMAFPLQVPSHLSKPGAKEAAMPTAARSPQPHLETADPDDALGAQESQVVATAPVEGRPSPEQIAREAYLIYLANGRQDGRHEEDWYEA